MRRKIQSIGVFSLSILIAFGCSSQLVASPNDDEKSNIDIAVEQIYENLKNNVIDLPKPIKITMETLRTKSMGIDATIDQYIYKQLKDRISLDSFFELVTPDQIDAYLGEMRILKEDLNDAQVKKEFANYTGIDAILHGKVINKGYKNDVDVHIWLTDFLANKKIAKDSSSVQKDKQLRHLVGEKIPGKIFVKTHPAGCEVFLNSISQGKTNRKGLQFIVEPSYHRLRIEKPGYQDFTKSIAMTEDGIANIEVKFYQNHLAPLKSMLASALLPGLGGKIYGSRNNKNKTKAESWLSISAGIFYVSGSLYAYDEYAKKPNFLISKDKNDFYTWKNAELGIAAASYVINIISSIVVGAEHKMRSRTTLEITTRSLDHMNNYYGYSGSRNVRFSARFNF